MSLHSCYRTGRLPGEKPMYGTLLNPDHPLSQGLVGCWLFNEGCGNKVFDLSGNGNHGDFGGGTLSYAPSWVAGRTGPALDFDGTDDYVVIGDKVDVTSAVTIVAWIKPGSIFTETYTIAGNTRYQASGYIFQKYAFEGEALRFRAGNGTDVDSLYSNVLSWDTTWYHVAVSYSDHTATFYRNGINVGSDTMTWSGDIASAPYNLHLGADPTPGYFFNGTIDEVLIYNRALSAAEIWQLYDEQYPMFAHPMEAELLYAVPAAYARSYGYIIGF